jgi:integrase
MPEKRITVWVQHFKDRPTLMLQWIDPETGRRKSKSAGTADEKQAEQARGDLEADLNAGRYAEASRMTWEGFRELFEAEYLPGVRPRTRKKYAQALDLFENLARPQSLRSISERTLAAFLKGMRERQVRGRVGMNPSTIDVYLKHLHTALAYAKRQRLIPDVPEFPTVRVPRKRPQPVPGEAFERLLALAPDPQWRAILLAAWLAGLRAGEVYELEWEPTDRAPWVDFDANRIRLPAEFVKGDEDQWVPLHPELRDALEALPRLGVKVFPLICATGSRMALSTLCDRVNLMGRKAGVKLSLHPLRRGFGCRYAARVPAQVLQKLMRHSNIAVTMNYYANVDQAVEEAVLGVAGQRNGSRNSEGAREGSGGVGQDANHAAEAGSGDDR